MKSLDSTPKILVRNTIYNLFGTVSVALCAIVLLPKIVHGLGEGAYGLLALALVTFSTMSVLELGLGRATTKFVAEFISKGEFGRLNALVWTSTIVQFAIGFGGGIVLAVLAPFIVQHVLKLTPEFVADARVTVYILAAAMPITLASFSLRGALEGAQRFDLSNMIKVPMNISSYLIPFIGVLMHWRVSFIVLFITIIRAVCTLAYFRHCTRILAILDNRGGKLNIDIGKTLFSYAGWVAVSSFIVPFLVQINQYLIGALVAVGAVTFYSVPYEMMNGLWIIPGAISATLFPVFSGLHANDKDNLTLLYARPLKYILISLGPFIMIIIIFAKEILTLWQGPLIAEKSSLVLKILAIGVLINSLEWVSATLLMGIGRPDVPAKSHLIQIPLYCIVAYLLISRWGVVGAAAAFTIRVIVEAMIIFIAASILVPSTRSVIRDSRLKEGLAQLFGFMVGTLIIHSLAIGLLVRILFEFGLLIVFAISVWIRLFDKKDREYAQNCIHIFQKVSS
jgi:O-antigen/teichoic acid export membrane protein